MVVQTRSRIREGAQNKTSTDMEVYIRVRPYNKKESDQNLRCIVKVIDKHRLEFDPKEDARPFYFHGVKQKMRDIAKKQNKELKFEFDGIFDEECTNEDVYNDSIQKLFTSLLEGYNCSVFVYGATGVGKTYTMTGNDTCPGITYLTMVALYEKIEELKDVKSFEIAVSYLEVYNENIRDLLNEKSQILQLREDTANGVTVSNLKSENVHSAAQLLNLLKRGNLNRTQHPTDANAESSRSHAVFQMYIKIQDKGSEESKIVKLTMIDLAGSERGTVTKNYGKQRFKEGSNINKSLLALGNCITSLSKGIRHVPYRDSKLTRLLKDSLGGNSRTIMIACIAPAMRSYEDTYNTLNYATRARSIKMQLTKNVKRFDTHDQYKQLIQELRSQISEKNKELGEMENSFKAKIKQYEERQMGLRERIEELEKENATLLNEKHLKQLFSEAAAEMCLKTRRRNLPKDRDSPYRHEQYRKRRRSP